MAEETYTQPINQPLTLDQMVQALAGLDAKVMALIDGLKETHTAQFEAYDKAIEVLQDTANRSPTTAELSRDLLSLQAITKHEIERAEHLASNARSALKELIFEKFASVQTQFDQNKTALDAALNAAKEAVAEQNKSNTLAINKSEEAFKKLLDSNSNRVDATEKATDSKITDIKDRVLAIEGRQTGMNDQRGQNKDMFGYIVGAVGIIVGALAIAGAFITIIDKP